MDDPALKFTHIFNHFYAVPSAPRKLLNSVE